jgi:hypothetical protein
MACPYFEAVRPRTQTDHSRSAMLPLGDMWDGACRAAGGQPWQPDDSTLLNFCNMGYARGCCNRFPSGDGADAARFTIAGDDEERIRLYYVLERDHHPFAHGPMEFSRMAHAFVGQAVSETVERLGRAYVESYLWRKAEASGQ